MICVSISQWLEQNVNKSKKKERAFTWSIFENLSRPFRCVFLPLALKLSFLINWNPFGSTGTLIGHTISTTRFSVLAIYVELISIEVRGIKK